MTSWLVDAQTYILRGREIAGWAEGRWGPLERSAESLSPSDWWMVKATGANGGVDVFVFHHQTRHRVLPRILNDELYVIQRYVAQPLLYHGRKFHFRCYAILKAGMRAYL